MTKPLLKDLWKHWTEYNNIPEEALDKWIANPNRAWHCIFCGRHGSLEEAFQVDLSEHDRKVMNRNTITACPGCREYKGVEPCIPEYCDCWHLDVIRKLSEKEAPNVKEL